MAASASPKPISPIALPPDATDLIVFGGSFDPPTKAHIAMAKAARAAVMPQGWLVFVPAARSPHKADAPSASDTDRVAMLELAIKGLDRAAIWTDELDRAGHEASPSFMIETIQRLSTLLRDRGQSSPRLRLLIGADQAIAFHRWQGFRELSALAEPLVMLREPIHTPDQLQDQLAATGAWNPSELAQWAARVVPIAPIEASATVVRQLLIDQAVPAHADDAGADQARRLDALLDPAVLSYISAAGLYRGPGHESA